MVWTGFALLVLLAQDVIAQTGSARGSDFLRFACSQLVVDRVDPLVNPGLVPASHMHQIVGGSSFNATVEFSKVRALKFVLTSHRWILLLSIHLRYPSAPPANCLRTSAITGLLRFTFNLPRMVHSKEFPRWRTVV